MEKKEMKGVKMEDAIGSSSSSSFRSYSYSLPSVFDLCEEKSSIGFMELLGVQNYSYSSAPLLDLPVLHSNHGSALKDPHETPKECSEVLNSQQPATPNSSSISSTSSEAAAVNDEHNKTTVDQAKEPQKQLKAKKTKEKRQREPRFAFMTKSEVDHLEDGYRWRKYGQKAVKNSPFPRSYYRCTNASCNVKKRVERSLTDPSIVVTTYEGQHTHPSPVMARPAHAAGIGSHGISAECTNNFGSLMPENYVSQYFQHNQQVLMNTLSSLGFPSKNIATSFPREGPLCINPRENVLLRGHGLLQDVVPSHMLKEE